MARFLSTPSARRATVNLLRQPSFSIYFYPRPPRGGRLYLLTVPPTSIKISIHALREEGDPGLQFRLDRHQAISIHALREEGD